MDRLREPLYVLQRLWGTMISYLETLEYFKWITSMFLKLVIAQPVLVVCVTLSACYTAGEPCLRSMSDAVSISLKKPVPSEYGITNCHLVGSVFDNAQVIAVAWTHKNSIGHR